MKSVCRRPGRPPVRALWENPCWHPVFHDAFYPQLWDQRLPHSEQQLLEASGNGMAAGFMVFIVSVDFLSDCGVKEEFLLQEPTLNLWSTLFQPALSTLSAAYIETSTLHWSTNSRYLYFTWLFLFCAALYSPHIPEVILYFYCTTCVWQLLFILQFFIPFLSSENPVSAGWWVFF